MAITRSKLLVESDNLWRVTSLTDKTDNSYINNATIKVGVCEDTPLSLGGVISDLGGGEVNLPIASHKKATGEYVRIVGSKGIDGEYSITVVDPSNIKITATYVADADYTHTEVYEVVSNGYQISISYVPSSDGDYQGTLPDILHIHAEAWYKVFTEVNATGTMLLIRDRLQAAFF